ncbi:MAG TPA: hypothetical protein VHU61_15530 [Solirubrobacteraceae bacterium]|jgi:hypothetical protein|nr:hypothetical protein [Solirubrobacteraceae bacterium]
MSIASLELGGAAAELRRRPRGFKRAGVLLAGGALSGCVAGLAVAGNSTSTVVAFMALLVIVAVWIRPQLGPVLIFAVGLAIEGFSIGAVSSSGVSINPPLTESIPMFQGLGPIHAEPADLLPFVILAIYMIRSGGEVRRWWPRSQISLAVGALMACALFAEVQGVVLHHGAIRESLFEVRPLVYIGTSYLVTAVMIRTRGAVQAMLWALVIIEPFKAVQGVYVWLETKNWNPKPQTVLGHEEAMFFTVYFLLVAALWLFGVHGRMRKFATWCTPLVFFADLVNDRRAAWLVLGFGFIVVMVAAYRALPEKQQKIRRASMAIIVIFGLYLGAFWGHTAGTLGAPADAVRSQFSPSARDALSDEYRIDEDANLKFNIKNAGPIGEGFAKEIDYALPMPGLVTAGDSGIMYVPHNGVLYLLMRMGILGGTAYWALLGVGILAACRLTRLRNRESAVIGAVIAASLVGWAIEGATDMGFTFPREAIVMGCLLGLVEAVRHIEIESHRRASGYADARTA